MTLPPFQIKSLLLKRDFFLFIIFLISINIFVKSCVDSELTEILNKGLTLQQSHVIIEVK